ncbi:STAS-like domain-containing protein [Candidatus Omnitrophota bacterium]
MDVRKLIIDRLNKKGSVKSSDIVKATGFSRTYINRFFQELMDSGILVLIGKANKAKYIPATQEAVNNSKRCILSVNRILHNEKISEDIVLTDLKKKSGIYVSLPENVSRILDYAFLEMLNNAIEHSQSKIIKVFMRREKNNIHFNIIDKGVGIFNNIMQKRSLKSEIDAIQDLLKGKQSTSPQTHSGEGIFFTSKAAEIFIIQSSHKKIMFNNLIEDIFIKDIKKTAGTKVSFSIGLDSKKQLDNIFKQYTDDSFEFSKTEVIVKLYKMATEYISRSQGRRILSGLDKFKTVTLDFKDVKMIGQGFADEVFRVWNAKHPEIKIITLNANENIEFMIKRALP